MGSLEERGSTPTEARSALEFLVGSWNRFEVLEATAETPRTREDLKARSGVSRVTLSRILSDLESRGWVCRADEGYEATRSGRFVVDEVRQVIDNIDALYHLGENIDWICLDQLGFEPAVLRECEVIVPTWDDFSAQTRMLVDLVADCTYIRGIGTGLDREFMKAVGDATLTGPLSVELVFEPDVVDAITESEELRTVFQAMSDSEAADLYRYDGSAPLMELGINETIEQRDDVVMLCGEHDEGAPPGTLRATNSTVWEWAESFFAERKADATELRPRAFTP